MNIVVGALIGAAAYAIYKRHKKRSDTYPTWSGALTSAQGRVHQMSWPDFKIIDGKKIRCSGADETGPFNIKGKINDDGSVKFTYTNNKSNSIINFSGNVVGPNQIRGMWEKGMDRGTFELSCASRVYYIERYNKGSPQIAQNYAIAFTGRHRYLVGLGVDASGFYRINGNYRPEKPSLVIHVIYPNQYRLMVACHKKSLDIYQGKWYAFMKATGDGDCSVRLTEQVINQNGGATGQISQPPTLNHPTFSVAPNMAAPFQPQPHQNTFPPQIPQQPHHQYQPQPQAHPQPVAYPDHNMFQQANVYAQPQPHQPYAYQPLPTQVIAPSPYSPYDQMYNGHPTTRPFSNTPFE